MSSEYKPRRITAIYFSPTNGTKEVVKNIKKKIEGAKITELDITKKKNREQRETITHSDADLAIVATPVYEGRIPPLVREYLKECAFVNLPVIAVVSYGNVIIGKALRWLVESLTKRGAKVIGFGAFVAEHSFTSPSGIVNVAEGRPDGDDKKTAEEFGKMIDLRGFKLNGNTPAIKGFEVPGKLSILQKILPEGFLGSFGNPSDVRREKCTNCGSCASICPVEAIDPKSLVVDGSKCIHCAACVKACPNSARELEFKMPWVVKTFFSPPSRKRRESWFYLRKPSIWSDIQ